MSETEDISTGEVMASKDKDESKKINSETKKDTTKVGASENKISELKEKVEKSKEKILNGDNGNSMDSISNGHDEGNESNDGNGSNDKKSASNGDEAEGDASNGDGDCEEVDDSNGGGDGELHEEVTIEDGEVSTRENTDMEGEEVSNGASSTPVVSEPTSPQRQHQKRKVIFRISISRKKRVVNFLFVYCLMHSISISRKKTSFLKFSIFYFFYLQGTSGCSN